MKTRIVPLILAVLLAPIVSQAQQSPSPQPTPAQVRPCTTTPTAAPAPANNTGYMAKLRQKYNDKIKNLAANSPVPLPTSDDISHALKANSVPCPPPPTAPMTKPAVPTPATAPKALPETSALRCNPLVVPPDAGGYPLYVLPNPQNYAVPKPNTVLADSVVPDLTTTTSCQRVRFDRNGKAFVQ